MTPDLYDVLALVGLAIFTAGVALISPALALIAAGIGLMGVGLAGAARQGARPGPTDDASDPQTRQSA